MTGRSHDLGCSDRRTVCQLLSRHRRPLTFILKMSPNVLFGLPLPRASSAMSTACRPTVFHSAKLPLHAILPDAEIAFAPDAAGFEQINRMDGTRLKRHLGYTPPSVDDRIRHKINVARRKRQLPPLRWVHGPSPLATRRGSHSAAPTRAKASAGLRSASGLGCRPSAFMSASA